MGLSRTSHRIESVWEGLRLVVEERPDGGDWQLFVYDEENCEVLYMAQHISCETAKNAAVKFAVAHLYSTDHDLTAELCTGRFPFWSSLRRGLWSCIAAVSDASLVLILLLF